MKRLLIGLQVIVTTFALAGISFSDECQCAQLSGVAAQKEAPKVQEAPKTQEAPKVTKTVHSVWVPKLNRFTHFQPRDTLDKGKPTVKFKLTKKINLPPAPNLPIDWAKTFQFPMDGNDSYGDCMYAAACHGDNTFTANTSTESIFNLNAIIQQYLRLSGGDNGLDAGQIINEWKKGLAGDSKATIVDAADIDPTDAATVQSAIYLFGGIQFMLAVPDAWINNFNPSGGSVWDAPARPNPNNGHGVWWNGVDTQGRYHLLTWGGYVWITPNGVKACNPSAFVVFSTRWFNNKGYAPNGLHYTTLSPLWTQFTGNTLPPSPFPPPGQTNNPSIDKFTIVPASMQSGQNATVTWNTSNATNVTLNGQSVAVNGSQGVNPATTTTYTLVANGAAGTSPATQMSTLTVGGAPPSPPQPNIIGTLTIPQTLPAGNYAIVPADTAANAAQNANIVSQIRAIINQNQKMPPPMPMSK